jgi:hypothetical protein
MTHPKHLPKKTFFLSQFRAMLGAFCDQNYIIVGVYFLISLRTAFLRFVIESCTNIAPELFPRLLNFLAFWFPALSPTALLHF